MQNQISSASYKFILSFWNLKASVERDMGRAIIDILKSQYDDPNDPITATPSEVGEALIAKAAYQLQNDRTSAQDAVQDLLAYYVKAKTDFRTTKRGGSGAETWRQALKNIYSNIRMKAMQESYSRYKKVPFTDEEMYAQLLWKRAKWESGAIQSGGHPFNWTTDEQEHLEKLAKKLKEDGVDISKIVPVQAKRKGKLTNQSIDEAFGTRPEGGGSPEGGDSKLPQPSAPAGELGSDVWFGRELDDQVSSRRFFNVLVTVIPRIRASLPMDQKLLFEVIFEDGKGGFGSDIKDNMDQGSALYERAVNQNQTDLAASLKKRPAAVGDIRSRLLSSVRKFFEKNLTEEEFAILEDEYFSDISLDALDRMELRKLQAKYKHWNDIDARKRKKILDKMKAGEDVDYDDLDKLQSKLDIGDELGRLEYVHDCRLLTTEENARYNELRQDMKKRKLDPDAIPPIKYDLGEVDVLAKLKWLEKKIGQLSPEQEMLKASVTKSLLNEYSDKIVKSIVPMKLNPGEKLASKIIKLAMVISNSESSMPLAW